jgi:hypothetical protein
LADLFADLMIIDYNSKYVCFIYISMVSTEYNGLDPLADALPVQFLLRTQKPEKKESPDPEYGSRHFCYCFFRGTDADNQLVVHHGIRTDGLRDGFFRNSSAFFMRQ